MTLCRVGELVHFVCVYGSSATCSFGIDVNCARIQSRAAPMPRDGFVSSEHELRVPKATSATSLAAIPFASTLATIAAISESRTAFDPALFGAGSEGSGGTAA